MPLLPVTPAGHRSREAAAEFQKIIGHSGIVWNCWTGALAHLGVARANALRSRTSQGADADAARVRALAVARALRIIDNAQGWITANKAEDLVLSDKAMGWYRDISLAGLTKELADASLFGVKPGGATGVRPRIGIFEQAMTNPSPGDSGLTHKKLLERAKSESAWRPLLTGGVVLLDEIADAPEWLQLKLLRLLNGERVYRVQGEGDDDWGFTFAGLVVLATWKGVDNNPALRPDLLQRIGQFRIQLPSLSDYPVESREKIISVLSHVFSSVRRKSWNESTTWVLTVC